jgi:hypothetical protein
LFKTEVNSGRWGLIRGLKTVMSDMPDFLPSSRRVFARRGGICGGRFHGGDTGQLRQVLVRGELVVKIRAFIFGVLPEVGLELFFVAAQEPVFVFFLLGLPLQRGLDLTRRWLAASRAFSSLLTIRLLGKSFNGV